MQKILGDLRADIRYAMKMRLTWKGILAVGVSTLAIAWIADSLGHLELTLPIINTLAVLFLIVAVKANLREKLWFWIFMAVVVALHVILLLVIPWTAKWVPAIAIAFIDSVDFFCILAALSVIANAMERLGKA